MAAPADWVEVPFRVLKEHDGMRVDAFLSSRLERHSRASIQRLIKDGQVLRRTAPVKPAARVAEGEQVLVRYPRTPEPPPPVESLTILYKDEALAVVDKPGGVLSHPTDKIHRNTVTYLAARQLGQKVHLAHRLDRETSGVMVLALTPEAAGNLYRQFEGRAVRKEYLAIVAGTPPWTETVVDAPIGGEGAEIRVRQAVGSGLPAVTEFRRLASDGRFTLVSARPRTGRLHQIRVHLAHLGFPVVGDKLYTGDGAAYMKAVRRELLPEDLRALGADRQLLHARSIQLAHPSDGRPLAFSAPVPADFPLRPEAP